MSATGHGGLTQISLTLAAAGAAGSKYTFTHNVGRALQIATVTNTTGDAISGVSVLQSSLNACVIQNLTSTAQSAMVTLQWEELSTKLNVVSSSDPRMVSGAAPTAPTIYVATTGSDAVGDGTQAAPFATIQRALDTLPDDLEEATVNLGVGAFDPPVRYPRSINLRIVGDRTQSVADLSAATFALAASRAATYTSNIGAYAFAVTTGSHWIESAYLGGSTSTIASASPNLQTYADPTLGGAFATVALHPVVSFLRMPQDTVNFLTAVVFVPAGVVYIGVGLGEAGDVFSTLNGGGSVIASALAEPTVALVIGIASLGIACGSDLTFLPGAEYVTVFQGAASGVSLAYGARVFLTSAVVTSNAPGAAVPIIVSAGAFCNIASIDILGTRAAVAVTVGPGATVLQAGSIQLVATQRTRFLTNDGGSWIRTAGTITGSTAGNCVVLSNGALATGLEAACSGTLANGSTPGNEIVVGGNAVTTFAALPTTDLAAGTPQLCRAT